MSVLPICYPTFEYFLPYIRNAAGPQFPYPAYPCEIIKTTLILLVNWSGVLRGRVYVRAGGVGRGAGRAVRHRLREAVRGQRGGGLRRRHGDQVPGQSTHQPRVILHQSAQYLSKNLERH